MRGRIPYPGAFVDGSSALVGKPRAIGKRAPELVAECQLAAENIAELTERKRQRVGEDAGVVSDLVADSAAQQLIHLNLERLAIADEHR